MAYEKAGLKYNPREREAQEEVIKDGWKVLYKGWPDFLCYKEENGKIEAFFMEIKRKPYRVSPTRALKTKSFEMQLTPIQEEMHRVLKQLGLEVKVIYKD